MYVHLKQYLLSHIPYWTLDACSSQMHEAEDNANVSMTAAMVCRPTQENAFDYGHGVQIPGSSPRWLVSHHPYVTQTTTEVWNRATVRGHNIVFYMIITLHFGLENSNLGLLPRDRLTGIRPKCRYLEQCGQDIYILAEACTEANFTVLASTMNPWG